MVPERARRMEHLADEKQGLSWRNGIAIEDWHTRVWTLCLLSWLPIVPSGVKPKSVLRGKSN